MKKLMVLGAGVLQANLMNAAKELGYYTIVASIPGPYPGFGAADEIAYVDISDPEAVLEKAKEIGIDGIATCCLDTGIHAVGYVAEKLGLCNISAAAGEMCNNKLKMKEALEKAGVSTAKFRKVGNEQMLDKALCELTLPVIVKAIDLQGSKGVYIANTKEEALCGFSQTMSQTRADYCIVEEFIVGNELGAQSFVYNNEILYVLPHGDNTYLSGTNVPIGHFVPLDVTKEVYDAAVEETKNAIRAIGLNNCAVNIDLIEKDGKIYVIELTGRAGATCLPELVSIYYGIDYYKMIACVAMGADPREIFDKHDDKKTANASRMLYVEKTGTVKSIEKNFELDDSIYDFSLIIEEGSHVEKFTNAKDRIGQVIVKADTYEECEKRIEEIKKGLNIVIE